MKFHDKPKMGTKVELSGKLRRVRVNYSERKFGDAAFLPHMIAKTTWVIDPCAPFKAIYIGFRTLNTGASIYHGHDNPIEWKTTGTIRAALVVVNERKNPIYVPFSHMEVYDAESS